MSTELILASTIFIAIGVVLSLFFVSTKYIGPNNKDSIIKNSVYESGLQTQLVLQKIRFSIKFYLVAISFYYSMLNLFICSLGL